MTRKAPAYLRPNERRQPPSAPWHDGTLRCSLCGGELVKNNRIGPGHRPECEVMIPPPRTSGLGAGALQAELGLGGRA